MNGRARERALTLWLLLLLHRRHGVVSRGACASLEGARVRRSPLGTPEGLDGTLREFSLVEVVGRGVSN
jgi:hypothetical protein